MARHVDALLALVEAYPVENKLKEDLVQRLSHIRALFKALCSRFGLARFALPTQYRPVGVAGTRPSQSSRSKSGIGEQARQAPQGNPGAAAEHVDLSF